MQQKAKIHIFIQVAAKKNRKIEENINYGLNKKKTLK